MTMSTQPQIRVDVPPEQRPPALRRHLAALPAWSVPAAALVALVACTITIELIQSGHSTFIHPENLLNILRQYSFVGIIAIGMTFVIILGGIDLSVGSLVAFLGGIGILLMNRLVEAHVAEWLDVAAAFALMLVAGMAAGAVNGLLVTRGRIAPFIATLGGLAAYRSLAMRLAQGGEFRAAGPGVFGLIGNGGIPLGFHFHGYLLGLWIVPGKLPLTLPWPAVILLVLAALAAILLNRTRYGRYVVAIGGNERAAVYSAIAVNRVKILTYMLAGLCTGIAAAALSSRMTAISSGQSGTLYELDAIAAVVIGGTRMRGGAGTIVGTLIGVLILGVVSNMLILLNVSVYLQGLVEGLVIIGAVLLQRAERL